MNFIKAATEVSNGKKVKMASKNHFAFRDDKPLYLSVDFLGNFFLTMSEDVVPFYNSENDYLVDIGAITGQYEICDYWGKQ